ISYDSALELARSCRLNRRIDRTGSIGSKPQPQRTGRVWMLVDAPQNLVLTFGHLLMFAAKSEFDVRDLETRQIPLEKVERFISQRPGCKPEDRPGRAVCFILLHPGSRRSSRVFPRNRSLKPVAPLHQRPRDSITLADLMKAEPAFIAKPTAVDFGVATRQQPEDRAVAMIDTNIAGSRATRANRVGAVQKPNAAFEPEVSRCQRAYRTNVDYVSRIRIVERAISKRPDRYVISALEKLHFTSPGNVIAEPDAARTKHASLLIEHHHRTQVHN